MKPSLLRQTLRFLLLPCACFALSWATAHLIRIFSSQNSLELPDRRPRTTVPKPPHSPPGRGGAMVSTMERLQALRESFASRPPGEWSALWSVFAAGARQADLETLARDTANPILRRLAGEELAVLTGRASGSPGAFAALAEHDPEAAWRQVRTMGQSQATAAVLRILAGRDPADALGRWREMPLRPDPRPLTADERTLRGRIAVIHSAVGSLFASWARNDPAAAAAAVDSLPLRYRRDVRNEVAMAWALRDGPAALRYVSAQAEKGSGGTVDYNMDVILLAAFDRWPRQTAALLADDTQLKTSTQGWGVPRGVTAMWYLADPDQCLSFFHETGKVPDLFYTHAVLSQPEAAARLLREFPPAASPEESERLSRIIGEIARRDSAKGLALAEEFGVRPAVESALRSDEAMANPSSHPAEAVDLWLNTLRSFQRLRRPLKDAQAVLDWPADVTDELAGFARSQLPEKSQELEPLLAAFDSPPDNHPHPSVRETSPAEPAAAALSLTQSGALFGEKEVRGAIAQWAPHDPEAARAWLSSLPASQARTAGQLQLAAALADRNPADALSLLVQNGGSGDRESIRVWNQSLQRLLVTGGDWQSWLARKPAASGLMPEEDVGGTMAGEAALLEALRRFH